MGNRYLGVERISLIINLAFRRIDKTLKFGEWKINYLRS